MIVEGQQAKSQAELSKERPILRGWLWRLLGWTVAVVVLASIGYAIIVLMATLLGSAAL